MICIFITNRQIFGKEKITTPKLENKIIGYKLAQYK